MTTEEMILVTTNLLTLLYAVMQHLLIKNLKEQIKIREGIEKNDKDYIKKLELRIKDLKS